MNMKDVGTGDAGIKNAKETMDEGFSALYVGCPNTRESDAAPILLSFGDVTAADNGFNVPSQHGYSTRQLFGVLFNTTLNIRKAPHAQHHHPRSAPRRSQVR